MDYLNEKQKEITQAREMVENRLATDLNDALSKIRKREHLSIQSVPVEEKIDLTMAKTNNPGDLAQIKDFLQRFDKFFANFYDDTTTKINDLSKEVILLKEELAKLRYRSPGQPTQQTLKETSREEKKKESVSPRSGNYTPSDVAIDKIFSNSDNRLTRK